MARPFPRRDPRQVSMGLPRASRACLAAAAAAITLALLSPVQAQFWGDWGNRPQRQQQYNNNWGGLGGGGGGGWFDQRRDDRRYYDPYRQDREAPVDYSRAPPSSQKKPEATTPIVIMGDANADWLAYGLEDAFSENPEIAVVRKHRTDSGLIRYDQPMTSAATSNGRRWRARSSRPRNRNSSS
ncbi:MAG: DUF459 domain-containing protein [Alphaproteobacteria bacterium]|nr:MAG: DUF459 domain-containing protein [Alphaproteobacteria bacterium]